MRLRATQLVWRLGAACLLLLLCRADAPAQAPRPEVLKIDPPSWWAGHSINPVRLLVRGRNLHGVRVSAAADAPLAVSGQSVNPAGTYLFVNLHVSPAAPPGDYQLTFRGASADAAQFPFRVNAPLDRATNFQGVTPDDVIYLIMPDRFADGDPSNNEPPGSPPEANDRRNPRAWHGGDFRGIINRLPYLRDLGVTALWLNPWQDNWNGVNRCDRPWCPSTYYHGYHTVDYYGVEDRFGDMRTLRELVERAHALGIKIVQDQVANHVVTHHPWAADPPLDNWFHGSVASHLRNPFRGDLLLSPHAGEARRPTLDGWFADDMPDMNQEEPEVARYEIQNALWWVGMTGLDGIRQDTIQYMPRAFIRDLSRALRAEYPRMWMVGEVFDRDPVHTAFFLGGRRGWDGIDTELDSVFDFPVWQTSLDVFTGKKPVRALRDALKYDAAYPDASRLTTMANNHDVKRFMSLEGATAEGAMLHVAFTLSIRGTPQLYYGEEIAMQGGDDPDNRRDFPGGFPGDPRDAFEARGRTPAEQRMYEHTRDWIRFRKEHPALRRGSTVDLFYDDDVYVFARRHEKDLVVIAINRAAAEKEVSFPAALLDLSGGETLLASPVSKGAPTRPGRVEGGKVTIRVPARTALPYTFQTVPPRPGRRG